MNFMFRTRYVINLVQSRIDWCITYRVIRGYANLITKPKPSLILLFIVYGESDNWIFAIMFGMAYVKYCLTVVRMI